jgi:hypothetical protein
MKLPACNKSEFYFVLLVAPLVIFFVMLPAVVAFVIFLAPLVELLTDILICAAAELASYSAVATAAVNSIAATTKRIDVWLTIISLPLKIIYLFRGLKIEATNFTYILCSDHRGLIGHFSLCIIFC